MRTRNISFAVLLGLGMTMIGTARADVQVTLWPADVPCNAISKNPDGSYTLISPVTLVNGDVIPAGTTFQTTDEYSVWVDKCG